MATKRFRKNRKSRKGGIFNIPGAKLEYENILNCKNHWSDKKNPARCDTLSKKINYPGQLKKSFGAKPSIIGPKGQFFDTDNW